MPPATGRCVSQWTNEPRTYALRSTRTGTLESHNERTSRLKFKLIRVAQHHTSLLSMEGKYPSLQFRAVDLSSQRRLERNAGWYCSMMPARCWQVLLQNVRTRVMQVQNRNNESEAPERLVDQQVIRVISERVYAGHRAWEHLVRTGRAASVSVAPLLSALA